MDVHRPPSCSCPSPLPLNGLFFFTLFLSLAYFLQRWKDKIIASTPLHALTLSAIAAFVSLIVSAIYLIGFFRIARPFKNDADIPKASAELVNAGDEDDESIIKRVVSGTTPSYSLEEKLGNCKRAARIRREALQRTTGRCLDGLPLEGFDYESILGQCCEMPVGYVQVPLGIAGPLLLDGKEFMLPMATTEGCLVASTNRGCKAIHASGGATSILLKDAMTRAPVVRFPTAEKAAQLRFFLEDPLNFDSLALVFNRYSSGLCFSIFISRQISAFCARSIYLCENSCWHRGICQRKKFSLGRNGSTVSLSADDLVL